MFYNDKGIDCIEFTRGHIYNNQKKNSSLWNTQNTDDINIIHAS